MIELIAYVIKLIISFESLPQDQRLTDHSYATLLLVVVAMQILLQFYVRTFNFIGDDNLRVYDPGA